MNMDFYFLWSSIIIYYYKNVYGLYIYSVVLYYIEELLD